MSGRFSDAILEEVQRSNDIVEVISSYVPLKRAGKDFKACCPFHAEKTPSFTVSPTKQFFKCFGCGKGGSVFQFVMLRENISFPEAVEMLAERVGVKLQDSRSERGQGDNEIARSDIYKAVGWAVRQFQGWLADAELGKPAADYLKQRGFTGATARDFRLGFVPDVWDRLASAAQRARISPQLMMAAGLIIPRSNGGGYYDRFRNRVIFPIYDTLNRPIAFGGRTLGDDPAKYLNSPDTPVFDKSRNVYGLTMARDGMSSSRQAIVVEGYTDCIMAHQCGVDNVVATLGTSLTHGHVQLLRRYVDEVVLVYDGDQAGINAADRAVQVFLEEELNVRIATLPDRLDPCDMLAGGRVDDFRALIAAAPDALEYKWLLVRQQFQDADTVRGQRRALEAMLETLAAQPAVTEMGDGLKRDLMLARMASVLGVEEKSLRQRLTQLARQLRRRPVYDDSGQAAATGGSGSAVAVAAEGDLSFESAGQAEGAGGGASAVQHGALAGGKRPVQGARQPMDELRRRAERLILSVVLAAPAQIMRHGDRLSEELFLVDVHRRLFVTVDQLKGRMADEGHGVLWPHLQDTALMTLASELINEEPPLDRMDVMLEDALVALDRLRARDELEALRRQASEGASEEERRQALHQLHALRGQRSGFLPPGMRSGG